MSELKITQGRWEWDVGDVGNEYPQPYSEIYVDGGEIIIASFNDQIAEGRANARLMAAAPDLYAALEGLVARSLEELADPEDVEEIYCAYRAMAKARGEAQ